MKSKRILIGELDYSLISLSLNKFKISLVLLDLRNARGLGLVKMCIVNFYMFLVHDNNKYFGEKLGPYHEAHLIKIRANAILYAK